MERVTTVICSVIVCATGILFIIWHAHPFELYLGIGVLLATGITIGFYIGHRQHHIKLHELPPGRYWVERWWYGLNEDNGRSVSVLELQRYSLLFVRPRRYFVDLTDVRSSQVKSAIAGCWVTVRHDGGRLQRPVLEAASAPFMHVGDMWS